MRWPKYVLKVGINKEWKYEVKAGTLGGEPVPKPLWCYLPNPGDFTC